MPLDVKDKKRVSAIIKQNDRILMIRRVKPNVEYYTFPGGTVEMGESFEEAMLREIQEELSVLATIGKQLFSIQEGSREDIYFLIRAIDGVPELGGPEKERMNSENQYHLEWIDKETFRAMANLYPNPREIRDELIAKWESGAI